MGKKEDRTIQLKTSIAGVQFNETLGLSEKLKKDVHLEWPLDVLENVFSFLSMKTKKLGMIVRSDEKHGVSYVSAGQYWLCITSKQEE